jgi:hypothetical protein
VPSGARQLRERSRAARPMLAGRPHEAAGNGSPRWMAAGPRERVHRTRPTGQLARRPTWKYVASPGHDTVPGGGRRRPRGQPASRCSAAGTGVLARSSWRAESARLDACLRVSGGGFGRLIRPLIQLPSCMPGRCLRRWPSGCSSTRPIASARAGRADHATPGSSKRCPVSASASLTCECVPYDGRHGDPLHRTPWTW